MSSFFKRPLPKSKMAENSRSIDVEACLRAPAVCRGLAVVALLACPATSARKATRGMEVSAWTAPGGVKLFGPGA